MKNLLPILLIISLSANAQVKYVLENRDTVVVSQSATEQKFTVYTLKIDTIKYKAPVVIVPTPTPVNLFANLTFESGVVSGFSSQEINKPTQTVVADPLNASNKVLKIAANSLSRDGDRIRNESTIWNLDKNGLKAAYRVDVFIPAGLKTDQNANNIIQLHNAGMSGAIPNLAFMIKGKQLDLNIAWAVSKTATRHDNGDIHKFFDITDWFGRWVKVAFECNWVQTSAGYFRLYIDGKLVYSYNGPMGYAPDTLAAYFKIGIHYPAGVLPAGSTETSQYILYDNIKVTKAGGTIADVQ